MPTTLTPEEADAYKRGGKIDVIRVVRYRTNLGLVETKRLVEMWIDEGCKISNGTEAAQIENTTLARLSEALQKLREAQDAIHEMRRKAIEAAHKILRQGDTLPEAEAEVWCRACGTIIEELDKCLGGK